ncbi:MAG TPA: hypothetical protein VFE47_17840 [Tepidisphaeraceae bacterium]|jgi:hypothetical protein|nr:hypothetical protein [Tepidisphaeraceae bacterium]
MQEVDAGVWGALGSIVVIGLEFWTDMNRNNGNLLVKQKKIAYWIGQLVRVGVGSIIAVALADAQQINGKLGALTAGIAAPLIVARLSQEIPRLKP